MKIAVVGPSPIPYTIGGAENLMWGLCDQINQLTEHQAELIKVPVRENNFWNLIDSYYQFYKMDLSHFDMIITSKYPSWMVRHDNSVCWMMHTLRGLYDTYHLMNLPDMVDSENDEINWILDYMKKNQLEKAIKYLTISTELSKEVDGTFDFTELIAKLSGKGFDAEETKPKFHMDESRNFNEKRRLNYKKEYVIIKTETRTHHGETTDFEKELKLLTFDM